MPQMAPLSWLSLYIIFTITLILFCMMNYYSFIPQPSKSDNTSNKIANNFSWKW